MANIVLRTHLIIGDGAEMGLVVWGCLADRSWRVEWAEGKMRRQNEDAQHSAVAMVCV